MLICPGLPRMSANTLLIESIKTKCMENVSNIYFNNFDILVCGNERTGISKSIYREVRLSIIYSGLNESCHCHCCPIITAAAGQGNLRVQTLGLCWDIDFYNAFQTEKFYPPFKQLWWIFF